MKEDSPIDRTFASFAWQDPVKSLVSRFKYQARLQNGKVLGKLLLEYLQAQYQGMAWPELLIPVPLHISRLRERGFNQSHLLAHELGTALNLPTGCNIISRIRQTPPQQGLSAAERRRNLQGAFAIQERLPDSCRSIAIVDDVITTMSTVKALANLLRSSTPKAIEIHVWALARA